MRPDSGVGGFSTSCFFCSPAGFSELTIVAKGFRGNGYTSPPTFPSFPHFPLIHVSGLMTCPGLTLAMSMQLCKAVSLPIDSGVCAVTQGYVLTGAQLWRWTGGRCVSVRTLDTEPVGAVMDGNWLLAAYHGLLVKVPLNYQSECADPGHSPHQVLWKGTDPEIPIPLWIGPDGRSALTQSRSPDLLFPSPIHCHCTSASQGPSFHLLSQGCPTEKSTLFPGLRRSHLDLSDGIDAA